MIGFIVNGEDVEVDARDSAPMWLARIVALEKSGNTGRPSDEFEMRDEYGWPISPTVRVGSLGRYPRVFLSLQVGAGGAL